MIEDPLYGYQVLKKLATGASSSIYLLQNKFGDQCIAKVLLSSMRFNRFHSLTREAKILKMLKSDNVVKILGYGTNFSLDKAYQDCPYILLEYCKEGDLFNAIINGACMTESQVRYYFRQILTAVLDCHAAGVTHRDIKLENCLLTENFELKLADFGLSELASGKSKSLGYRGTPIYMAPEVHRSEPYSGEMADIFALGVSLFAMYNRGFPFYEALLSDSNYCIFTVRNDIYWSRLGTTFSTDFINLVNSMLAADPSQRISLGDIFAHPWLQGPASPLP